MRSVFVYITESSMMEVEAFLSREFPGQSRPWIYPTQPQDNVLYIDLYDDLYKEEPDYLAEVISVLGEHPYISIKADISGRHPGNKEVDYFMQLCLRTFKAVAQDDYSSHAWTLSEIQSGHQHQGHSFFDYLGWYNK